MITCAPSHNQIHLSMFLDPTQDSYVFSKTDPANKCWIYAENILILFKEVRLIVMFCTEDPLDDNPYNKTHYNNSLSGMNP